MNTDFATHIRNAPKADLHNHLTLGYPGLPGIIHFIHTHVNKIMCDTETTIQFMELAIEDSIADNVILLEASIDVKLGRFFDNSMDKLILAVEKLKQHYTEQTEFKPDIGIDKDIDLSLHEKSIYDCMYSGIYNGIDLYGRERNRSLERFRPLFTEAKRRGLKTKVHIGEFSNNRTIEEAITLLEPDAIQHGIRSVRSEETLKMIKERNITLNVCPQSNVSLMSVMSIKHHPIRRLVEYGIPVTINTDDLLLFNATVSDQYLALLQADVLDREQLEQIRINSLNESRIAANMK
jgi:adenosine deaminase